MQIRERFIVSDSSRKSFGSLNSNYVAVKQKLCEELFILQHVRERRDAVFSDADVLEGDNSECVVFKQPVGDGIDSLVAEWVVVQIDLAKLVLVRKDAANFLGADLRNSIVFQIQ